MGRPAGAEFVFPAGDKGGLWRVSPLSRFQLVDTLIRRFPLCRFWYGWTAEEEG